MELGRWSSWISLDGLRRDEQLLLLTFSDPILEIFGYFTIKKNSPCIIIFSMLPVKYNNLLAKHNNLQINSKNLLENYSQQFS